MESFYQKEDKRLIFKINEDIDECVVQKIRRKLDNEIERYMPKEVIFDFNKVSFMDSAGIGLIIGRYKLVDMLGGKVEVTNLTTPVRKIFEMSGVLKIIPEVRAKKEPTPNCRGAKKEPTPFCPQKKETVQNCQEVRDEQHI